MQVGSTSCLSRVASVVAPSPVRAFKAKAKKGKWIPSLASPAYLDRNLAGDNGFDPLGLAEDPANLKWYVQEGLQNGRWAMLGVAGTLIPDILTKIGLINVRAWYDAGKVEYFAPASTLFVIEFILFHYVEVRRWQDIKYPGSVNTDLFNPKLTLPPGEHNIIGKSPVDNLFTHLAGPWHNTIIQTLQGFVNLIGWTPLVELKNIASKEGALAQIVGKLEWHQPLSYVKDRIALL
ncbi:hypothetical protein GOP47_0018749 [Adiantum capillus-veneris]|uniref:Chlorophyll a-b binding protein, chloroplastic n=1 Tax=Adiantum capillus-veneris TaxID=13818 RepID=A0A9D4UE02_ADICA|nr:hypothetical protein GOP47_0018749 [Adiantum capillus-veneris]